MRAWGMVWHGSHLAPYCSLRSGNVRLTSSADGAVWHQHIAEVMSRVLDTENELSFTYDLELLSWPEANRSTELLSSATLHTSEASKDSGSEVGSVTDDDDDDNHNNNNDNNDDKNNTDHDDGDGDDSDDSDDSLPPFAMNEDDDNDNDNDNVAPDDMPTSRTPAISPVYLRFLHILHLPLPIARALHLCDASQRLYANATSHGRKPRAGGDSAQGCRWHHSPIAR
jgi:hypothetical protein